MRRLPTVSPERSPSRLDATARSRKVTSTKLFTRWPQPPIRRRSSRAIGRSTATSSLVRGGWHTGRASSVWTTSAADSRAGQELVCPGFAVFKTRRQQQKKHTLVARASQLELLAACDNDHSRRGHATRNASGVAPIERSIGLRLAGCS